MKDAQPQSIELNTAMVEFLHEASDRVAPTISEYEVDPRVNNQRRIDPQDPSLIEPLES